MSHRAIQNHNDMARQFRDIWFAAGRDDPYLARFMLDMLTASRIHAICQPEPAASQHPRALEE